VNHPETPGFDDTTCPNGLRAQVFFPSCWDGVNLDSADHKSHMAYPSQMNNGFCPSTHPVHLISIFYEVYYSVDPFNKLNDGGRFVLANGDSTGYGLHGDFLNGWNADVLQRAVDTCTNLSGVLEDCGVFENEGRIYTDDQANQCSAPDPVGVVVDGSMPHLPGCVAVTDGPGQASPAALVAGCVSGSSTAGASATPSSQTSAAPTSAKASSAAAASSTAVASTAAAVSSTAVASSAAAAVSSTAAGAPASAPVVMSSSAPVVATSAPAVATSAPVVETSSSVVASAAPGVTSAADMVSSSAAAVPSAVASTASASAGASTADSAPPQGDPAVLAAPSAPVAQTTAATKSASSSGAGNPVASGIPSSSSSSGSGTCQKVPHRKAHKHHRIDYNHGHSF
jgi:hypothetical protein